MINRLAIAKLSRLVVLPHSVFALPFALASLMLAADRGILVTPPGKLQTLLGVVLAVVAARTAAMTFNRIVDRDLDANNPRTANRELPQKSVSLSSAWCLLVLSSALFIGAAAALGKHCAILAPAVLVVLFLYSYTKRFTYTCHFFLGLALALGPGGAWWVLRPNIETVPLLLMGAVMLWVSGFDIIYSCQDEQFDRSAGLHSIPARFGVTRALTISRFLHALSVALLFYVGIAAELCVVYFIGVALFSILLAYQHTLVRPNDLSRVNQAFFTVNGVASIFYFLVVCFSIGCSS